MMRRNPGYTCAVVITLALGIGLNAAMYGLLSRLFLQAPPHIQDPGGIHRVYVRERSVFSGQVSTGNRMEWSDFTALRAGSARFGAVAGSTYPRTFLTGRGQATENLHVSWVTGEFFALLGVRPALGRLIGPEDDDLAATPVAVIGDGYGRRRFGRVREALGATVSFDDVTYVIVGVLPPGFSGPRSERGGLWLPVRIAATASRGDTWRRFLSGFSLMPFVRLAPGVRAEGRRRRDRRPARVAHRFAARRPPGYGGDRAAGSAPADPRTVRHRGRPAVAPARRRRRPGRAPRGRRQRHEPC